MNLEGITINILTSRLQEKLLGGKIYKVFMPNKSSLLLLVKTENAVISLAADFSGASPYLYMPDKTPERPETPPAFCMLLRKHLEEGRITKITQSGLDRVITMEISSIGSARQIISKQLIFELTGKNANIIFVSEGVILDSLKHIGKALSSYRQILPGLAYIAPPSQNGLDILTSAPVDIAAAAQNLPLPPQKALIAATTGIGQYTAGQLLKFAGITAEGGFTSENIAVLADAIGTLQKNITAAKGLSYRLTGDVILVGSAAGMEKFNDTASIIKLNYAKAEELKTALAPLIGTNSKISTDTVTNSIIFTGTPTDEMRLRSAVAALDTATQQVTLEAKIIAVNREDSENLGISWNWDKIPQNSNYYGNDDDSDDSDNENFGGVVHFGANYEFRFNAALNALFAKGKAKILATPRIITIPGREASIFIGEPCRKQC